MRSRGDEVKGRPRGKARRLGHDGLFFRLRRQPFNAGQGLFRGRAGKIRHRQRERWTLFPFSFSPPPPALFAMLVSSARLWGEAIDNHP